MERGNGKAQMVLLVDQALIDRADALRIVMNAGKESGGMNRARVLEAAIDLRPLEEQNVDKLLRLEALAHRAGMTLTQYVRAYAERHQRKTYAPTLEDLESAE